MTPNPRVEAASTVISNTVETVPLKVPVDTPGIITAVQIKLRSLGYVEAGSSDGGLGPKTEAAILDFRNRNNLPMNASVDGELLAALLVAEPKPKTVAQETATVASIAPEVKAVRVNLWTKFQAKWNAVWSFVGAAMIGIVNKLGDAIEMLRPVRDFLESWLDGVDKLTMISVSLLIITVVAAAIYLTTRETGTALVKGYEDGTVKPDNQEAAR